MWLQCALHVYMRNWLKSNLAKRILSHVALRFVHAFLRFRNISNKASRNNPAIGETHPHTWQEINSEKKKDVKMCTVHIAHAAMAWQASPALFIFQLELKFRIQLYPRWTVAVNRGNDEKIHILFISLSIFIESVPEIISWLRN